ncbi:MAG TPA: hypothetical protein VEX11_07130, partial [Acetobacteraceae bacterium]|nr:hypothetical protein [Acetobacteraceae bacterium]
MGVKRGIAIAAAVVGLLAAATPASAATPRPFLFGLNDPHFEDVDTDRALRLHQRLGSTIARVGLPWRSVQPQPGGFGWGYGDRVYRALTARGIRPVFVVSQAPGWAQSDAFVLDCLDDPNAGRCQRPPGSGHLGDFARFTAAVAARYPRLAAIEVFNEPNLGNFNWHPTADPEHYAGVLRAARDGVRSVRGDLPVISGGITLLPQPPVKGMLGGEEFLSRMYAAGARGAMDGIGLHPYPGRRSPTERRANLLVDQVRGVRDRNGDRDVPLWITETGYTTQGPSAVSEATQAEWLPEQVTRLLRAPDVAAVLVHTLADSALPGNSGGFGLTHRDLSPKPVFDRLTAAVSGLRE